MKTRFKLISQKKNACAPSSIYIAVRGMGINASLRHIEKISKYYPRGMSHGQLVKTIELLGVKCKETRFSNWTEFKKAYDSGNPIIVSWMPMHLWDFLNIEDTIGHFSVVEKVTKNFVVLVDPNEDSLVKMSKLHFLRVWFDYDVLYPRRPEDISLRWGVVLYPPDRQN